ncbi:MULTISPECIES: response regulator transcription factor [Kerstersia]|uniref:response regulator transcription factor n=1 Tax=Kerstersia TaxID=257820 RepID=UPI00243175F8|nr:response regulator transcription factor [Kerstersia gyiorum]MCH4272706.1 response regulator transcription factor [Kerstersia gyiorum]
MRILVVEDNSDLGEAIQSRLRRIGHTVEWVCNGADALRYLQHEEWDGMLLDIMLPDSDGFAIIRQLRQKQLHVPTLVMTARAEIEDKVGMLDLGADDYLVKPFDLRELEARLRALLRRQGPAQTGSIITLGKLVLDSAARRVMLDGAAVDFGRREFCLLEILIQRRSQVVSKERLMTQLFNFDEESSPNAVELLISRIRRKLGNAVIRIDTIRGTGYSAVLVEPE